MSRKDRRTGQRTNQAPFEAPPAASAAPRSPGHPWLTTTPEAQATAATRRVTPYELKLKAARNMVARVVQLELEAAGELPVGDFKVTVNVSLNDQGTLTCTMGQESCSCQERLTSLAGGLALLLSRQLADGEDFVVLSREQREALDRLPLRREAG